MCQTPGLVLETVLGTLFFYYTHFYLKAIIILEKYEYREGILMYDLKMLEEIKSQEERIHFSSFDYNDAYTLGTMLRERGLTTPKPIAIRIVFDDIILYQSFLPGTDESNNQWMNRKQHTVERCHTSSLRAAVERELNGVKENWQQDESHYAFCGGGFPIIVNDEFRGVAMISGLPHLEDHRNLVEVMDQFCAQKNA